MDLSEGVEAWQVTDQKVKKKVKKSEILPRDPFRGAQGLSHCVQAKVGSDQQGDLKEGNGRR